MSRQNPKRTSRTNTPRPRKIAGASLPAGHSEPATETPDEVATDVLAETSAVASTKSSEAQVGDPVDKPIPPSVPEPTEDPVATSAPGFLASARATKILIGVLAVLTVVLVLQLVWLVRHQAVDPPEAPKAEDGEEQVVVVPSGTPIVPTALSVQEGVEVAAEAARLVSTRSWKDYDAGVDEAAALMTPRFEPTFRETAEDVKDQYLSQKTVLEARVVAQGVVRANDTELQALVFLNQYVVRGEGENPGTNYTPYRALMTMVHTDDGWLVDDIETQ